MNRNIVLEQMRKPAAWDLIVIGGGATGLGTALEAAVRGYRVLLIEQSDFAKSTSSKSTKLVHGGVRYLAQGDVALVREASIERGLLVKNAPHLVKNLSFIIPVYTWFDRLKYTVGLKMYDWIAGRLSLGSSVFVSRQKVIDKMPTVVREGLKGGILYHDGQFDDARLALNLAQTLEEQGGFAINYVQVKGLLKNQSGKVCGVKALDLERGEYFELAAAAVVNATGVFVDDVLKMDQPDARKSIAPSQGVHLVLERDFLPSEEALMIPETPDGRVLFAVPWHGKLVVGTTDTPVKEPSLDPVALEEEIQFILDTAGQYLLRKPKRSDVLSVFAGLRPLAAPQENGQKTKEISRSHKIMVSPSGLFTMLGGKWTTYRKMGEDMVNKIEANLGWKKTSSGTKNLAIHGFTAQVNPKDPLYFYGSDAAFVKNLFSEYGAFISEKLNLRTAQVIWAVQHEMARTVDDVLSRRTRCLLLDAKAALAAAPIVASVMATALGKDARWESEQVAEFERIAQSYVLESPQNLKVREELAV